MKHLLRGTDRSKDEKGQALMLALAFLIFFGILIGVILSYGDASFRGTLAVRSQRWDVFAADGATDGAINLIRGNASLGREAAPPCPDFQATIKGVPVTVTCKGLPGSG